MFNLRRGAGMVTVIIPTKGRPGKLLRCIQSIPPHVNIAVHATCHSDIPDSARQLDVSFGNEGVVQSFNLLADRLTGDVLPACDDVEFMPGCIEALEHALLGRDGDAVVGSHVVNRKHNEDAFVLVGRKIIRERGYLFYPEFRHFFIDFELGSYARSSGRFLFNPSSQLVHHHPEVSGEYDTTHSNGRMDKWRHDKSVWDRIKGKPLDLRNATPQTPLPPSPASAP